MHQCCTNIYDLEFDKEHAQRDLDNYNDLGPKKNSKPLIQMLRKIDMEGLDILDIGGGVGTVIFELFKEKIKFAAHIDISSAYVQAFRNEAESRYLTQQTKSYNGDFLDLHKKIEQADIVTLDKVICCYQNYDDLIRLSTQKATKWFAFAIPRDVWWVKLVHFIEGKWQKIKGKHFKTYVHPIYQIENIIKEEGLNLHEQFLQREWYYAVYKR